MSPAVALRLGRVSNLPTVWTNALAGVALAGASPWQAGSLLAALGLSLAYVGGMYLNDAFDREIDARERPERPIPAGQVPANLVFALGHAMLLGAVALLVAAAWAFGVPADRAALAGVALGLAILFYDLHHKANRLSPLVMGACRVLGYLSAGLAAAAALTAPLVAAALVSLSYLIGLTYVAKQETLGRVANLWPLGFLAVPLLYGAWLLAAGGVAVLPALLLLAALVAVALRLLGRRERGGIPRAVVTLIAGIALLDAVVLAGAGWPGAAAVAILCCGATLAMQRWIRGT